MSVEPQRKGGDKLDLYERQINMLDTLLQHGAISEEQYQKSAGDLEKLMFPPKADIFCLFASTVFVIRSGMAFVSITVTVAVTLAVAVTVTVSAA